MTINLLAEGHLEEFVAVRLLSYCNHNLGTVYGRRGCRYIKENAVKFRHLATSQTGLLILTDFRDAKTKCAANAVHEYLLNKCPNPPKTFFCRFAVNELESWLLADREGIAKFLCISVSRVPLNPEGELYPKATLVNLARISRKKGIREGIAPRPGHRADVGMEYIDRLCYFIMEYWDIDTAEQFSPSFRRCIRRLREI